MTVLPAETKWLPAESVRVIVYCVFAETLGRKHNNADSSLVRKPFFAGSNLVRKPFFADSSLNRKQEIAESR